MDETEQDDVEPAPAAPSDPVDPADEPADDVDAVEEPASDIEGEGEFEAVEINAAGDTYSLTIANYVTLKNQVTLTSESGTISSKGVITAKEGDGGARTPITLTIAPKSGWKITKVEQDGTAKNATDTYTITSTADSSTVTVTTVATYQAKVTGAGGTGINVITSDAADAVPTAINVGSTAPLEKGKAMKFEVAGSTAVEGTSRLKVYYIADGSSDAEDRTEITPKTEGTGDNAKTYYTVEQNVIDSLDGAIEIVLVAEEKVAVTVNGGDSPDDKITGTQVEVLKANSTTEKEWGVYTAGTNNKAFPGEKFKFRVKTADNYVITEAKFGEDPLTGTDMTEGTGADAVKWTSYEVTAGAEGGNVVFKTAFDTAKKSTLTYTLAGKAGSATAKITGVVPVTKEGDTATDTEIAAALGIKEADLTLTSGTPVDILKPTGDGAAVEVTVTATENYELKKITGEDAAVKTRKYTFTGTTLTAELAVAAETEPAVTEGNHYFKITTEDADIKNITVDTASTNGKVVKKPTATATENVYYEVQEGVQTVKFTVDVKEDSKLTDASTAKAYSVKELSTAGGFTKYEVLIQANMLVGTTDAFANADEIELVKETIKYTANLDGESSSASTYDAEYAIKDNATTGTEFEEYTLEDDITYNHAFKAVITPKANYNLEEVSYTMGDGDPVPVTLQYDDSDDDPENWGEVATLEIAKVTGNVVITIKTQKDTVKLGALAAVTEVDTDNVSFDVVTKTDGDGIYAVEYQGKYVVDVLDNGTSVEDPRNISVVVKDGTGAQVAVTTPLVTPKEAGTPGTARRSINLANKNLAGQEITAEVSYKGEYVGTYIMQVGKKTTDLSVNGGAAITQSVDSVAKYPIVTDGAMPAYDDVTVTGELASFISTDITEDGKLEVTVKPAKQSDIATSSTDADGKTVWTPKKAVIKVVSPDDIDIFDEVEITATPLFAEDAKATLNVDSSADVLMNVTVNTGAVQKPVSGHFEYSVTATPVPGTAEKPLPGQLKNTASTANPVNTNDTSAGLTVYVANSTNLGEGAAWDYKLTATVLYKDSQGNMIQTLTLEKEADGSTQVPVFEDALKLKKTKNTTFYTGWNSENASTGALEIATPVWKNGKYQVLDSIITDDKDGVDYDIVNGNIVITGVDNDADLGKHTVTVLATRDETGKYNEMGESHTSYASRATVSINIVKGINELTLTTPATRFIRTQRRMLS